MTGVFGLYHTCILIPSMTHDLEEAEVCRRAAPSRYLMLQLNTQDSKRHMPLLSTARQT